MVYKTLTHQKSGDNADGIRILGNIAGGAAAFNAMKKNAHPVAAIGGLALGAAIGKRHPKAGLALGVLAFLLSL